jgi:hypothetical protein
VTVPDSKARQVVSSFGATFVASQHLRMVAAYETQWPFYDLEVSGSYSPSVRVGMTYMGL